MENTTKIESYYKKILLIEENSFLLKLVMKRLDLTKVDIVTNLYVRYRCYQPKLKVVIICAIKIQSNGISGNQFCVK